MFIYEDIQDAPFMISNKVRVLDNPNGDETFNEKFINKIGIIIYFEYECGCGQTYPIDPMIGVQFSNGNVEEFWKEELLLIS